jgi:putative inorganic carbon (HCO3(-)) transporter
MSLRRFPWSTQAWAILIILSGVAIALQPPTPLSALLVLVAVIAAVLGGPEAAVAAVFVALPFWQIELHIRTSIFGPLELALLLAGSSAAVWAGFDFLQTRRLHAFGSWLPDSGLILLASTLLLLGCLSLLWVADLDRRPDSIRALRRVIIEPLFIIPALTWLTRTGRLRMLLPWLAVPAVGVSALALVQSVLDRSTVEIGGISRPIGTFTHPNNLAFYLERAIWFLPVALLPFAGKRTRWVWVLAGVVAVACLATLSRGASLGLIAGACIYFEMDLRKNWRRIVVIALPVAAAAFLARYLASSSSSVDSREVIWRSAIAMLRDHPFPGIGLDQFLGQYGRRYVKIDGWAERYTSHPHNVVLDFWLSLGVAGLVWLWFLIEQIWRRYALLARSNGSTLRRAALAMLLTGLVHGLIDNSFFLPDLATWTWIGLILASPWIGETAND